MNDAEKLLNAMNLKQRDIIDMELRKFPTSALPRMREAFLASADLIQKEIEFRELSKGLDYGQRESE